jgi:hypothetical protein
VRPLTHVPNPAGKALLSRAKAYEGKGDAQRALADVRLLMEDDTTAPKTRELAMELEGKLKGLQNTTKKQRAKQRVALQVRSSLCRRESEGGGAVQPESQANSAHKHASAQTLSPMGGKKKAQKAQAAKLAALDPAPEPAPEPLPCSALEVVAHPSRRRVRLPQRGALPWGAKLCVERVSRVHPPQHFHHVPVPDLGFRGHLS